MTDVASLMNLEGAVGAFKFTPGGELLEHRLVEGSNLNESALDLLCHVCVANMAIATMQARGWENMTGMGGFYPVNGFTLVGFEWTAIVNGEYGVVLPNDKVDYEKAYAALGG
ncbi:MAG: DUF2173 family protein [Gammaproteobacteria bacterium]|nr:DUF2173 family protein [Gammaproteobacteria bacterium]MDH5650921.1 DUF2173 family protein [Gammaproteobacteria bacterium]